jgi:hypothetical protein
MARQPYPREGEGMQIESSLELKMQIVFLAIVSTVLACVGFVIIPLLYTQRDPVISVVFAVLLAITSIFLGGSLVYAYYKVRVATEARQHAESMVDRALDDDKEGILAQQKRFYESWLAKERDHLVSQLDGEKRAYIETLKKEFERRLDDEERNYIEEIRGEFNKQLEKEKQAYGEQIKRDFERQKQESSRTSIEQVRLEMERQFEREKEEYAKRLREEYERQKKEDNRIIVEELRLELEKQLDRDKKDYFEQVRKEYERQKDEEKRVYFEQVKSDFERRLEKERTTYAERIRQETDRLKIESERQLAEARKAVERKFDDDRKALEKKKDDEKKIFFEDMRVDFERKLERERRGIHDQLRREFEKQLDDERKGYIERIRDEFERQLEKDKQAHVQAVKADMGRQYETEHMNHVQKLRQEFEDRLQQEKRAYSDDMKRDFEDWKRAYEQDMKRQMDIATTAREIERPQARRDAPRHEPEVEVKPEPPTAGPSRAYATPRPRQEPLEITVGGETIKARDRGSYNFSDMSTDEKFTSAIELLSSRRDQTLVVVLRNTQTRKQVGLRLKGASEICLESKVEDVSIKGRLQLREYCAQNKLRMDKTDEQISIFLGVERDDATRNLREVMPIAFGESRNDMKIDVKLEKI